MRAAAQALGFALALVFVLAQFALWGGTSLGIVREHCADLDRTLATGRPTVESKWTYVIFPPLAFANLDPAGACVRNAPLLEALSALGIWELPSPQEQVAEHIRDQLAPPRR